MVRRPTFFILQGLLIALGVPALPLSEWEHEFGGIGHLLGYEAIWWGLVAVVLCQALILEQSQLSSLGFRRVRFSDAAVAVCVGVVTVLGIAALYYGVLPRLHLSEASEIQQLTNTPGWWRFISVVRAAVSEELLFRGYAIGRLRKLTGSLSVAAFISWAIFTLEHVGPWGWGHLLIAGFGGLMLTGVFLWRMNIWSSMIAHFIIDGAIFLS